MTAETLPLFNVDHMIGGKPQRAASNVTLAEARIAQGFQRAYRRYRTDREKPLPLKMAHSISPKRGDRELEPRHKAKIMAEHIRRTGQTELAIFYTGREVWPNGVPSSVREFNDALFEALGSKPNYDRAGRKQVPAPFGYTIVYVDQSKDVTCHDD